MTSLFAIVFAGLVALAIYLGVQSARHASGIEDHLDAGASLSGWTMIFAGSGILLAAFGPLQQIRLVSTYGLQASHLALALIPTALVAALFQKRLWFAARILARQTPGETFGAYYGSPSVRIIFLGVLFLYAVPWAATQLHAVGEILSIVSGSAVTPRLAMAATALVLFLLTALGGWRATVYAVAALTFMTMIMLAFSSLFIIAAFDHVIMFTSDLKAASGVLQDAIPGVIQFSSGIGSAQPASGIWTTTALTSTALAIAGVALSPSFGFLTLTVKSKNASAFSQVWMVGGLAAGLLLLLIPVIAAQVNEAGGLGPLSESIAAKEELAAACFSLLLLSGLFAAIAFFASSAANIFTLEFLAHDLLPDLTSPAKRLASRITLAVIFIMLVVLAIYLPAFAESLGALALPLSAQLFPAYLGLCWLPWMGRSAVLSGFILGSLVVLFTEPLGLSLFSAYFVELPWGRWPLTIHSAAWGLAINLAAAFLAAIFTRKGDGHEIRHALHAIFHRDHAQDFGGHTTRSARWSLTLLWLFLALGPGAILGNTFFSRPMFFGGDIQIGLPSLWVWQIVFWIIGVMLVWWMAYQGKLSIYNFDSLRAGELRALREMGKPANWLQHVVSRLSSQPNNKKRRR